MDLFKDLCIFLNLFYIGDVITRKSIFQNLPDLSNNVKSSNTIDNYRNWFHKAGYLETIKPGHYKKLKDIPNNLTSVNLRREAYPKKHQKND